MANSISNQRNSSLLLCCNFLGSSRRANFGQNLGPLKVIQFAHVLAEVLIIHTYNKLKGKKLYLNFQQTNRRRPLRYPAVVLRKILYFLWQQFSMQLSRLNLAGFYLSSFRVICLQIFLNSIFFPFGFCCTFLCVNFPVASSVAQVLLLKICHNKIYRVTIWYWKWQFSINYLHLCGAKVYTDQTPGFMCPVEQTTSASLPKDSPANKVTRNFGETRYHLTNSHLKYFP